MTREIIQITARDVVPELHAVLAGQGIPRWVKPEPRTVNMAHQAISFYQEMANPVGLLMEIESDAFKSVFEGEGRNEAESPLDLIYQSAAGLALFAITIGETVCAEISRMFRENDFALGAMLDATCSESAELAAQAVENVYRARLKATGRFDARQGTLRFSPGYCGWHISAQKKLFEVLEPGRIGMLLNDHYLMKPLKSISGVIVAGDKQIFDFEDVFSFCRDCTTHTCRDRIKALFEQ